MTKTLYATNILEFVNIRVTCKKCGLPQIATERYLPAPGERCPQCRAEIDSSSLAIVEELRRIVSHIHALNDKKYLTIEIEMETRAS